MHVGSQGGPIGSMRALGAHGPFGPWALWAPRRARTFTLGPVTRLYFPCCFFAFVFICYGLVVVDCLFLLWFLMSLLFSCFAFVFIGFVFVYTVELTIFVEKEVVNLSYY